MNAPISKRHFEPVVRVSAPTRLRYTLDDYYKLTELGVLDRFGRTELIDGEIIRLNALHLPHAVLQKRFYFALEASVAALGSSLEMLGELTAELSPFDGPQPDMTILDWAIVGDRNKGAPLDAIRLVVEVADSSYRRDLGKKRKLYGSSGIPEYWVVVLPKHTVERFAEPSNGDYLRRDSFGFGQAIEALTIPGVGISAKAFYK